MLEPRKSEHRDLGMRELPRLRLVHVHRARSVAYVFQYRHVRKQGVGLEDHTHVAFACRSARDVPAPDQDTAVRYLFEPGNHAQRRSLAATRRTQQRNEVAGFDTEGNGIDRRHLAVALGDGLENNARALSAHCLPRHQCAGRPATEPRLTDRPLHGKKCDQHKDDQHR